MQASCRFYLTLFFLGWTALDVGGGGPGILTTFLGLLFNTGPYSKGLFQADIEGAKDGSPEELCCPPAGSTPPWSLQGTLLTYPELTMNHSPQIPFFQSYAPSTCPSVYMYIQEYMV